MRLWQGCGIEPGLCCRSFCGSILRTWCLCYECQRFQWNRGAIIVQAEATGPSRTANLKLVLDTGATKTLINLSSALSLGFDPANPHGASR